MREDAAMRIENEELLVEINPLGGALSRIYDKKEGKEILYDGKGAWMKTDLILFPVIGANNVYSLNGEQYRIPWKHGFAQHALFETEILSEASLVLSLQGHGEKESGYPFPFFLKLAYSLKGRELLRKTEIKGQDLTFQFGLHPAFRTDFSSCLLEVEEGTDLFVLDRTDGVIKKEIPWPYPLRWRIQKEDIVDHDTFVLSNPKGEIRFRNGLGTSIHLRSQCPYFALWTPKEDSKDDFLCLESWYGISPYADMPMDLSKRKGVNRVDGVLVFEDILDF